MSAHSTIKITRLAVIIKLIEHIQTCSDVELKKIMDSYLDDRLYSCIIVNNDEENENNLID